MAQASDIREHMEVIGADGVKIGTVDHMDGERIKLTRRDSADGEHHYIPLADVTRVDAHVHVGTTAAVLGLTGSADAAVVPDPNAVFPPVLNRQVEGATPRGNYYLPWIVGVIGLILLFLLFRSCVADRQETTTAASTATVNTTTTTAALPVETVQLPNGRSVDVSPNTLNYALQRYLASNEATPRTFTFDKLNFDTGSAAIRAEDQANVDALAQILGAYPAAKVTITGYTDARGTQPANVQLGAQRAQAVAAALAGKGVDKGRIATATGGESDPADTNATAGGRFDNRRSELTVTAK